MSIELMSDIGEKIDTMKDPDDLVGVLREQIEQLEAEVESWKNSYERVVAEGAELIRKALEEGSARAHSKLP